MKIIVVSPTHGITGARAPIHDMFCRRMAHIREKFGIEMLVIGSDGDVSREMTEAHGHMYLEHENYPVSNKWNAGMEKARVLRPDYVMTLDSDDFLSDSLFEDYLYEANSGKYNFIGVGDSYFTSFHMKRAHFDKCFHWPGYKGGSVIMGCSRMMRSDVLDCVGWAPWPQGQNYALNNHSHHKISKVKLPPAPQRVISVLGGGHMHIDIKTNGNISSISPLWKGRPLLDYNSLMLEHFPPEESAILMSYRAERVDQYAKRKK